jgi:ubiquitin C-terminal hydrolase
MLRALLGVRDADRRFLIQNLRKLINVKATDRAMRVALVEKSWHDSLLAWLQLPSNPPPGPICTSRLLLNDRVSPFIVQDLDFAVIDYSIWNDLVGIFGKARLVVRHYVLHPSTKKPVILLDPISLDIDYEGRLRKKSVSPDWTIGDVKRQLCFVLNVPNEECELYCQGISLKEASIVSSTPSTLWTLKRHHLMLFTQPNTPKHIGFRNLGNTCFFNSAVQCLLRVPPLLEFVISPGFLSNINRANPQSSGGRIASAFRELAETIVRESSYSVSPQRLHSEICRKYRIFSDYGQHDSQELLGALLDGLHEDLNHALDAKGKSFVLVNGGDPWDVHISKNSSKIVEIFHGALGSSIECPKCQFRKVVRDPFSVLSIPIPKRIESRMTLERCLEAFTEREVLDVNNKWKCEQCGKMVQAIKRSGIQRAPAVLVVHLKRFEGSGWSARKIATPVSYPDLLDVGVLTGHRARYKLIGAVLHDGTCYGGHYTAVAFDQIGGKWHYYNDSQVREITKDEAHSDRAYILLYQKI